MFNTPYFLYMAETEGMDNLVTTRTAKLNAMLNDIKRIGGNTWDLEDLIILAKRHNINNFSGKDIEYLRSNF